MNFYRFLISSAGNCWGRRRSSRRGGGLFKSKEVVNLGVQGEDVQEEEDIAAAWSGEAGGESSFDEDKEAVVDEENSASGEELRLDEAQGFELGEDFGEGGEMRLELGEGLWGR